MVYREQELQRGMPQQTRRRAPRRGFLCFIAGCVVDDTLVLVIHDRLHPVRIGDRSLPPHNALENVLVSGPCRLQ